MPRNGERGDAYWRDILCAGENGRTTSVTETTVRINRAERLGFALIGPPRFGLMLMLVMTEMFCCCPAFVLAIGCHRCPTELQRHQYQQKNHKQAAHGERL